LNMENGLEDEQRRHIARELHDSAGQTLAVLAMNLGTLAREATVRAPDLAKRAEASEELVHQYTMKFVRRRTSYILPCSTRAVLNKHEQNHVQSGLHD